jgi:N6-L-threonylcarbamoyladenine synthase
MLTLGIESSCDESGVALVDSSGVRAELVASQIKLHKEYGGVVPELAAREHLKNLPLLYREIFTDSLKQKDISGVAVTSGPGLKGCLMVGVEFAKGIACSLKVPLIEVNHIEAHIFSVELAKDESNNELKPPFLALIVSGGHTELQLVNSIGSYKLLARTSDDAVGEAFDKAAYLLDFDYPGGAELARLADDYLGGDLYKLPRSLPGECAFSFSGIKTAIARLVKSELIDQELSQQLREQVRARLAASIQENLISNMIDKVKLALQLTGVRQIACVGGVSANRYLRRRLNQIAGVKTFYADFKHCLDNAAMVAHLGRRYLVEKKIFNWGNPAKESLSYEPRPRWRVEEL